MSARKVLRSIENPEGTHCVDAFRREDGSHGFQEYRRDAEDAGRWTPVGLESTTPYATADGALEAAADAVPWLADVLAAAH